jgi:hypothetical protein
MTRLKLKASSVTVSSFRSCVGFSLIFGLLLNNPARAHQHYYRLQARRLTYPSPCFKNVTAAQPDAVSTINCHKQKGALVTKRALLGLRLLRPL